MTRMVRPMTIEDEQGDSITIDALDVTDFDVLNCMLTIEHQYQEHLHFPSKSNSEIFRMFNAELYEALNAPVLATEEVLGGLYMAKYHTGDFEPQFLVDTQTQSLSETSEPPEEWVDLTPKWAEPFLESRMFPMSDEEEWCYRHYAVANGKTMYKHEWEGYENVVRVLGHKIKANECTKTAEYLRQFYTDGTPILK